jgi:prophage regulatory protein
MDQKRMGAAPGAGDFTTQRLLRLHEILAPNGPLPISRSSFWAGVKEGRYPRPIKLGPRTTCWRAEDINALIENLQGGSK